MDSDLIPQLLFCAKSPPSASVGRPGDICYITAGNNQWAYYIKNGDGWQFQYNAMFIDAKEQPPDPPTTEAQKAVGAMISQQVQQSYEDICDRK